MIHDGDGIEIGVGPTDAGVTDHNGRLREIFFDELHDFFVDDSLLFNRSGRHYPFLPSPEMGLDERRRLLHGDITDDGQDDLIGEIFFGVEVLHVRQGDLAQGFLRPVHRPTVGMILKNQLIEGLHGDMPGIVIITGNFTEDLRSHSFELLFGKGGALKNVGEERESKLDVFLQRTRRCGREIFAGLNTQ